MKKNPPEDDGFFSMDELLRQLTPEEFEELNHNMDVRIRRIQMRYKTKMINKPLDVRREK